MTSCSAGVRVGAVAFAMGTDSISAKMKTTAALMDLELCMAAQRIGCSATKRRKIQKRVDVFMT
jgi:hypothetical protein